MGGIDWIALPFIVELLGVTDVEQLIADLVAIRQWERDNPPETD